jgi:peptidoglycan/xylan/chitin deacetylase (PgdA/CDA1 family)
VLATLLVAGSLAVTAAGEATAPAGARACPLGEVSLTFDDGPSPRVTPRLVRILERARVPATFFMVGERVAAAPRLARAVDRAGFVIANHTNRHAPLTGRSVRAVRATLQATDRRLRAAGTRPTRLMRPPYGLIDDRVRRVVADLGMVPVMWDVDPRDWEDVSSTTIAARILSGLRPHGRNIVLQHDGVANSPASVAALPRVIREARSRGYCFVALDDAGRPGFRVPRASLEVRGGREGRAVRAVVTLARHTARTTRVRLTTHDLSARAGADFERRRVTVRFPAGSTRRVVRIPVLRDGLDERPERFEVGLSHPFGVTLGRDHRRVRVVDRDRPPRVRLADVAVAEPVTDPAVHEVLVSLGRASARWVRLHVVDVPGTATTEDYVAVDRWVRIAPGELGATVPVTVLPDEVEEPEETFEVRVVAAVHARVVRGEAVVTVTPPVSPRPDGDEPTD